MYVVLSGDVISGVVVWGPFMTGNDAVEWAEAELTNVSWITTTLESP